MDELDSKLRNLEELEEARAKEAWEKHVVSRIKLTLVIPGQQSLTIEVKCSNRLNRFRNIKCHLKLVLLGAAINAPWLTIISIVTYQNVHNMSLMFKRTRRMKTKMRLAASPVQYLLLLDAILGNVSELRRYNSPLLHEYLFD